MRITGALILAIALAGCGSSPPTRFYSLEPTAAVAPTQLSLQAPIKVDAVHVPSVLDRKEIVKGEHNYQLSISSQDRWGGDFGDMVRRVLTQDLQQRLPAGMVIGPDNSAPADARGVVVDILSFQPRSAGVVELDADWVLLQGSPPRTAVHRSVQLREPFEGSVDSQADAMSRLVGKLADDIARASANQPPGGNAPASGNPPSGGP